MKKWISDNEGIWKGVFGIIIGLIMLAWPGLTTRAIVVFLGVSLLVLGIVLLISWFRRRRAGIRVRIPLASTVCILIGLAMTLMPQLFINILMVIFGILLVLAGLDQMLTLFMAQRSGNRISYLFYIAPAVVLLVGFYIMFSPAISARTFIILFGITAIISGIIALCDAYVLNRTVNYIEARTDDER